MFAPYNNSYANPTPPPTRSTTFEERPNHERLAHPPSTAATAGQMSGRVRLLPNEQLPAYHFALTGTPSINQAGGQHKTSPPAAQLGAMQQSTALSRAYFSPENTQILHNALRKGVHDATGTIVHEQDTEQLQLVMRSVFLQHSRNQTHSAEVIREQIQEMNTKVTEYCVPVVVSNLKQHQQYLVDVSTMPVPLDMGLATSQAGSRSLELKPFFV